MKHFLPTIIFLALALTSFSYLESKPEKIKPLHEEPCSVYKCMCKQP